MLHTINFETDAKATFCQFDFTGGRNQTLLDSVKKTGIKVAEHDYNGATIVAFALKPGHFDRLRKAGTEEAPGFSVVDLAASNEEVSVRFAGVYSNSKDTPFHMDLEDLTSILSDVSGEQSKARAFHQRASNKAQTNREVNTMTITRKQAGDQLDQLAIDIQKSEGVPYSQAFEKVKSQRADLFAIYAPQIERSANGPAKPLSRTEAGDQLDEIARQIAASEGLGYSAAFNLAKGRNPELAKAYASS